MTLRPVPEANAGTLKLLIEQHLKRTFSPKAEAILDDWDNSLKAFVEVMPNEILALQQKKQAKIA